MRDKIFSFDSKRLSKLFSSFNKKSKIPFQMRRIDLKKITRDKSEVRLFVASVDAAHLIHYFIDDHFLMQLQKLPSCTEIV